MADDSSPRKPPSNTGGQGGAPSPSGAGPITVPRLFSSSVSMWASVIASVLASIGIAAWGVVTQDGTNRLMSAFIALIVLICIAAVTWRRTWVDPANGTISQSVLGIRVRSIAWAEASTIALEPNRAGQLALRVSGASTVRLTLVANDLGGPRAMPASTLRLLADEISTWTTSRERLVAALRGQADFLADGGAAIESPLARYV